MSHKYIFMVEVVIDGKLEILGCAHDVKQVREWTSEYDSPGIVTKMKIGEKYPSGIGACDHWHFG